MSPKIIPVFCNEKNMANYAYIITIPQTGFTLIIDAAEATPIIKKLEELNLKPSYILTTHHHFDHVGANEILKQKYDLKIIAPEKEFNLVPGADIKASAGILQLENLTFNVIDVAGHTKGHVLYHLPAENKLFTGDTLFNLCIGGLFEGTPQQMYESLQKIKALPDNTEIFPGHEYTRSCLPAHLAPSSEFDAYLQKMLSRENGNFIPATLAEEKAFNPYLQPSTLTDFLRLN